MIDFYSQKLVFSQINSTLEDPELELCLNGEILGKFVRTTSEDTYALYECQSPLGQLVFSGKVEGSYADVEVFKKDPYVQVAKISYEDSLIDRYIKKAKITLRETEDFRIKYSPWMRKSKLMTPQKQTLMSAQKVFTLLKLKYRISCQQENIPYEDFILLLFSYCFVLILDINII